MGWLDKVRVVAHVDPYGNLGQERTVERLRKLLSPRWLMSKLALTIYERRHPDHPWMTRDAVRLLESMLRPGHRGLEWGSGNGTPWFAKRCASLISIEHHDWWHEKIKRQLEAEGLTNVDYRLVPEAQYIDQIDTCADGSLDFVIVDGLFRGPAFLRSLPKLKPGGFVVFDNVNWYLPSESHTPHSRRMEDGPECPELAEVMKVVEDWKIAWTTNGVNDTAIFYKPGP